MNMKKRLMATALACAVITGASRADVSLNAATGFDPFQIEDIQVDGTSLFNDTLTVQPAQTTVVGPTITTPVTGDPTELDENITPGTGGPVSILTTLLNENEAAQTTQTGGGLTAETNGDTTLAPVTSETTTVNYGRAVTQEVPQDGNVNPVGVALPGTEQYFVVNLDTGAQISGPFASETALDAFIATQTPDTLLLLDPTIGESVDNPAEGGNLDVGGNALVRGVLTIGSGIPDSTNPADVADVAAAINGNAGDIARIDGDATTVGSFRKGDADNKSAINGNAGDIARIDGDKDTDGSFREGDAATLVSAQNYVNDLADGAVAENTSDIADNTSDIGVLSQLTTDDKADLVGAINEVDAQVTTEKYERILADNALKGQINNNAGRISRNKRDIETNTRGIAMVAAMTNTTVLPGNTQAIDFNLSHFEGETGFGFGYARAINPNLQLKVAAASTTDLDESVIRVGVSYQW
jgi:hypothetical protein